MVSYHLGTLQEKAECGLQFTAFPVGGLRCVFERSRLREWKDGKEREGDGSGSRSRISLGQHFPSRDKCFETLFCRMLACGERGWVQELSGALGQARVCIAEDLWTVSTLTSFSRRFANDSPKLNFRIPFPESPSNIVKWGTQSGKRWIRVIYWAEGGFPI